MNPQLSVGEHIYTKPFPNFERPKIIGCINIENLKFARRIREKKVSYDLNIQLNQAIRKPDNLDVKLDNILTFMLENERRLNLPPIACLKKARIICYRGLLTSIACTPYENKEPWKIAVTLFRGDIYLCARDTPEKLNRISHMTQKDRIFSSWGYKFEQFMLSDTPKVEPNPNIPVDENDEFCLIFTTHLNSHCIIYGAEMDGIRCDKGSVPEPPAKDNSQEKLIDYLSTKEFIELKTNKHMKYPVHMNNFMRFKTKKWWCQSFLVGIDTIICGCRNNAGIVEQLKVYRVNELAKMSRRFWNASVCFNFLDAFLSYVKECLSTHIKITYGESKLNNLLDLPLISLLLEWSPGSSVHIVENYSHEDDPILTPDFLENYGKCNKVAGK